MIQAVGHGQSVTSEELMVNERECKKRTPQVKLGLEYKHYESQLQLCQDASTPRMRTV